MRKSVTRGVGIILSLLAGTLTLSAQPISDAATQQIQAILQMKASFTPAQQKIGGNLVFAAKAARQEPMNGIPSGLVSVAGTDAQGLIAVEIKGNVTAALLQQIQAVGQVTASVPQYGSVSANIPLAALESVAALPDVLSINPPDGRVTNGFTRPPTGAPERKLTHAERRARIVEQIERQLPLLASNGYVPNLGSWLSRSGLASFVGAVTSQGYITHRANQAVALGINGTGVKIGVLSDSASPARVAALIATGDLPADVTVLTGQAGTGADEGTAMMELIHDLAPGAKLFFASAFISGAQFAANIIALRNTYGCDIIVDDVTYFSEGAFQDGPIAQAVNTVTASGALYFSSAANSGNLTFGTSGTWEGDFVDGGAVSGVIATGTGETGNFHSFGGQNYDVLTSGTSVPISLKWSDPLGASSNDYDLFALNAAGTILKGFSAQSQSGASDPFEIIGGSNCGTASASGYCSVPGDRIVVVLFSGSPRALRVDTNRGTLSIATSGSTSGHNAGLNTVCTAATFWNSAHAGTKPFTGAANPIEPFSSDGPRKIFYNPDGSEITPGNLLFATNGGTTLQKPDITAADGTFTKTPGFLPFFGTSAAAPHAAAIAGLVKSANPALTNVQIKNIMTSTALDNMAPGTDRNSGFGIVMALPAVQAALAFGPPL